MTTEKLVNKALFGKTELASQKIELGTIDDAKKGMDIVLKAFNDPIWNKLERIANEVAEVVSGAKGVLKEAGKGQGIAIENARKASVMAKELGVPNPKEIDDIFKNNDYDTLLNALSDDVNKIIANAKR